MRSNERMSNGRSAMDMKPYSIKKLELIKAKGRCLAFLNFVFSKCSRSVFSVASPIPIHWSRKVGMSSQATETEYHFH